MQLGLHLSACRRLFLHDRREKAFSTSMVELCDRLDRRWSAEGGRIRLYPAVVRTRSYFCRTYDILTWHEWDPATWSAQCIYRTTFAGAPTGRVFLDFDGVLSAATVSVNGHEFDRHLGGYLPASYEITGQLRDADNVIAVVVDGTWLD